MSQSNIVFILLFFLYNVLPANPYPNNTKQKITKAITIVKYSASGQQTLLNRKERGIVDAFIRLNKLKRDKKATIIISNDRLILDTVKNCFPTYSQVSHFFMHLKRKLQKSSVKVQAACTHQSPQTNLIYNQHNK